MNALILARRQDTGGQNIRWKQAADRIGGRMHALIVSPGQDNGGVAIRYAEAAERLKSGLHIRSVHASDTYIRYATDIRWAGNEGAIRRLYDDADVIHANNSAVPYHKFDRGQKKPVLLHHHGAAFRADPKRHLQLAKRHNFESAVSTVDLMRPAPDRLTWLPTAYHLPTLAAIAAKHRREPDGVVRVAHAPTNRKIKSTQALIDAVATLQDEGLRVELDIIEGVTNAECMARKAAADIYFDQVILGYGCNAVESWGMGLPVIAGADPWTLARMAIEYGSDDMPFYTATERTITDALRTLVTSADARAEYAARGMAHVEQFHAEEPALARLVDLYLRAIARRPKTSKAHRSSRAA